MSFLPQVDTKLNVWTLAAVLTALYTLFGIVRGWWNATLGKRRRLVKAYRRIAPYVGHDYVKELVGEPAWAHKQNVLVYDGTEQGLGRAEVELTVRTWPLGTLGYLVTWSNEDDECLVHSLTTRSVLFRPRVRIGGRQITLGRSRLSTLSAVAPGEPGPWETLGARRFSYAERHYFGNTGGYLDWVVGVSDTGSRAQAPIGCDGDGWSAEKREAYRRRARINSLLVAGAAIDLDSLLPYGIAPDADRVRLLELRHPARVALTYRLQRVAYRAREFRERQRTSRSTAAE
ncbi:ETEC_3214 domain-containing protein [Streptomyces xanthophaeus]|uniref:ETEC_3214 domain-containing protein n=1 Tax=Streptomyces xanthophaeus TaxID=67385 RepID=UPI003717B59C